MLCTGEGDHDPSASGYTLLLLAETRDQAGLAQAVPSTWDIFCSHHSFVKIRLNVSPSVKLSSGKLCLASMHYFPSLHHSPVNPHGKYLSTCLFSSNERLCSSTLISNSNNVVNLNNELNLPLYYVISFL